MFVDEEDAVDAAHGGAWDDEDVFEGGAIDGGAEGLADAELGEIGVEAEGVIDAGDGEEFAGFGVEGAFGADDVGDPLMMGGL